MEVIHLDDLRGGDGPGLYRGLGEHAEENGPAHEDGGCDEEDDLPLLPSFLEAEGKRKVQEIENRD